MITPLQFEELAKTGKLYTLDPKLLTEENLLKKNKSGETPLHLAAMEGFLEQIPEEILTEENLRLNDHDGWCPLFWAGDRDQLNWIPYPILIKHKKFLLETLKPEDLEKDLKISKRKFTEKLKAKITDKKFQK
jgi:hypothetical protein